MKLKESVKIECKKTQQRKKERERGLIELDRLLYRRMITFFRQSETDTKIFRRINEEAGLTCLDIFVGILCFFFVLTVF